MPANTAAELGPSRFQWWQDWRGECAAIVASGPSTSRAEVEKLRDRIHVIAIKATVDLCPFADVVYGCDAAWWKSRRGLPEFKGVKLAYDKRADFPDLHRIEINTKSDAILTDVPGVIGSAGNSGFQGFNIAVQFGATAALLIGFDMTDRSGVHYYGRNNWPGANNPSEANFRRWRKAFADSAPGLAARGIDVVNASMASALNCFPKMSVDDALKRWGL